MTQGAHEDDERDAERLAQWLELVPTAPPWLECRLGVTLTGSPDDLVALWTAAMPLGAFAAPVEPYEALPAWARWPQTPHRGTWSVASPPRGWRSSVRWRLAALVRETAG